MTNFAGLHGKLERMASYSHNHKQYTVRMILLGEAGAGKSSLYYRIKFKVTDYMGSSAVQETQL